MAIINGTYVRDDNKTTVTWANVATTDTANVHIITGKPDLAVVQLEGTYNNTIATLTGSLSGVGYVAARDLTGVAISTTSNAIYSVLDSYKYVKPTVSNGTSDSITVTLMYWTR